MIVTGAPTIIRESWGSVKTFEFGHKKWVKISNHAEWPKSHTSCQRTLSAKQDPAWSEGR